MTFESLGGDRHRHGSQRPHAHPHAGPHVHQREDRHDHEHGHSHGLVDESIKRSREGLRAVGLSLTVLAVAAMAQLAIFIASGSIALLADLIHNFGDAATAIPLGIAFLLRSQQGERVAGLFVVAAIFISACVAGFEAVSRLIDPQTLRCAPKRGVEAPALDVAGLGGEVRPPRPVGLRAGLLVGEVGGDLDQRKADPN